MYRYQKGDYESMRADTLKFAKWLLGYPFGSENFNLITYFIQVSADKHIPSKTSRSVSSVAWITPEIRRKIRRRNITYAKAKKVQVGKDQEKAQSEKDAHSKNRGGKKPNQQSGTYTMKTFRKPNEQQLFSQ